MSASKGGRKLSQNTVKGYCVGKPSVSQPHLTLVRERPLLPAQHCSLSPLLREQAEEVSLKKNPVIQDRLNSWCWSQTAGEILRGGEVAEFNSSHELRKVSLEKWTSAWLSSTAILQFSVLERNWTVNFVSGYLIKWGIHFSTSNFSSCFKFYNVFSVSPNNPEFCVHHFRLKLQSSCDTDHSTDSSSVS